MDDGMRWEYLDERVRRNRREVDGRGICMLRSWLSHGV